MFAVDPHAVPVSVPGSLLTIGAAVQPRHRHAPAGTIHPARPGLFIRHLSHFAVVREVARLVPLRDGRPAAFAAVGGPQGVDLLLDDGGRVRLVPTLDGRGIAIGLHGAGLRLEREDPQPFDHVTVRDARRAVINSSAGDGTWLVRIPVGRMAVDAPWQRVRTPRFAIDLLPAPDGHGQADLTTWRHDQDEAPPAGDPAVGAARLADAFACWVAPFATDHPHWGPAVALAAWLLWSNQVGPVGMLRRRLTYQSQYKMTAFWTWDCCFTAIGLAAIHPDRAWEELLGAFDHQAANGALPASFDDGQVHWNHAKPPVHGWTLRWLRERGMVDAERCRAILEPLARWTDWWFGHLDWSGTGLPVYTHGNDSGWDNASCFDVPPPWTAPDLPAFLAVQLREQAIIADLVGDGRGAAWRVRADALVAALVTRLWHDGRFVARTADGAVCPGDSLLACLPIVLGMDLPETQRRALTARLEREGGFLTPHGLASEHLASPYLTQDGYWRGSIWAPPVVLIADGLARIGATTLARRIAARFCATCARAGFSENFAPHTGDALRDPTYAWTAGGMLALMAAFPDLVPGDAAPA